MAHSFAWSLQSFRRQHLLVEFASLKHVQLRGVYVSLTPGDNTFWTGVLFVRKGPYAPAILRFHISFPATYPLTAPIITFTADLFHPLLTPLTTYTYTGVRESDTVSSVTEERLPPGAFSLRHGFPHWFNKGSVTTEDPDTPSSNERQTRAQDGDITSISVVDVLYYVRSCFEDETILDAVPFSAAANSGAWYAWQAYREQQRIVLEQKLVARSGGHRKTASVHNRNRSLDMSNRPKHPSEWNWEGVWEDRVKKAVQTSISEGALFGTVGVSRSSQNIRDDDVHFLNASDEEIEEMLKEVNGFLDVAQD